MDNRINLTSFMKAVKTCEGCRYLLSQEEAVKRGYITEVDPEFNGFCAFHGIRIDDLDRCSQRNQTTL